MVQQEPRVQEPPTKKQKTLEGWKANIETQNIHDDPADAFISVGSVPFRFLRNPKLQQLLARIPGYKPLSRRQLVSRLDGRKKSWTKDKAALLQGSTGYPPGKFGFHTGIAFILGRPYQCAKLLAT